MENGITWNYSKFIYVDGTTKKPVFYKEGTANSGTTLPTGTDAAQLADGSLVRFSGGADAGLVKTYCKESDSWSDLVKLST